MVPGLHLVLAPAAMPMLAVAAIIFVVGLIYVARERSSTTVAFFVMTLCASIWLAAVSVMLMSTREADAVLWTRLAYVGVCAIPTAVLQFSLALADKLRERRTALVAAWASSGAFIVLFTSTDLFIIGATRYSWGYYGRLSNASVAFLLFFTIVLTGSLIALGNALRGDLSTQQKHRIGAFLGALVAGYIASVDFLPSFGVDVYPFGSFAVLAFIALSVRAIHRFHFADLTPSFVAGHLLDTVQGGVLVVDMRGRIRVCNPTAAELLGYAPDELPGRDLRALLNSRALPATDSNTFASAGHTRNRPMLWRKGDGSRVELAVTATQVRDREQMPVGILYVINDLAERRRAEKHEFAANHDPLTGLANRTFFRKRYDETIGDIAGNGRVAALMFLDLDGFKQINDQHGHMIGDRVLQLVAARLRNALRDDDTIARYGGDEFVVLVSLRTSDDSEIVARKLTAVLRESFTVDDLTLRIAASIGVATSSRDGRDIDQLVSAADAEMYRAKRAARGEIAPAPRPSDRPAAPPWVIESRA